MFNRCPCPWISFTWYSSGRRDDGLSRYMALLTREDIITALERLGQLAAADGYMLHLVIVGGAAMVLGYDARPSTRDIDALFVPPPEAHIVRTWATVIARANGGQRTG